MNSFMMFLGIFLVFLINPVIAYFNAKNVGECWTEVAQSSLWEKSILISALVQSVIGFSMPSLGILLIVGYFTKFLTLNEIYLGIDLFWISAIIPLVGSGLIITIQSVKNAIKEKSLSSGLVAAWNVGATVENFIDLFYNFGSVLKDIGKRSDDENDVGVMMIVILVVCALFSGFLFTSLSFRHGRNLSLTN